MKSEAEINRLAQLWLKLRPLLTKEERTNFGAFVQWYEDWYMPTRWRYAGQPSRDITPALCYLKKKHPDWTIDERTGLVLSYGDKEVCSG